MSRAVRALPGLCLCGLVLSCGGSQPAARHRARPAARRGRAASAVGAGSPGSSPGAGTAAALGDAAAPPPSTTSPTPTAAPATRPHRRRRRASPGSLPQTMVRPSSATRGFHAEMHDLWRGITTDSVKPAMPAFFPETAYAQVKVIYDPGEDWQARLVGDYLLDIEAAHALLAAGAKSAELLRVDVPGGYAHWIPPNVCENRVGYYEVANSRVVYSEGGSVKSLGIASLISWRGVWYVVHLGAVDRQADTGVVDDPATGPGVSADSDTC